MACGFCGTEVREGYNTCAACGATRRRVIAPGLAKASIVGLTMRGIPCALFPPLLMMGNEAVIGALLLLPITAAIVITRRAKREWVWYRVS